ncbi:MULTISPECIES: hypothetical protein [unclassified Acinetobacter]|uniref:hypothetical protein n=1 Tax=Acinetobacter TaxID=469 RepID=UPI00158E6C18|nr:MULTISPECIES: hypothetical protein [unclassified Acinetobacter]QKW82384.1 hypothetical protein FOC32_08850 [Acinetobacter sp. FDAARGOS_724]
MSTSLDGLQFPISASQQKPSTSKIGRNIISEALGAVDPVHATAAQQEKNWRKQYPLHFKHLVEGGLRSAGAALSIAKQGLETAHASFEFYRDGQKHLLKDVMSLPAQNLNTFQLKGQSEKAPEWYVPYHGKKLQGQALLDQIQSWENRGIVEPSHANVLRECIAHPEWFDLSDRTTVLLGAASEAGPLIWLSKWKANIVAIDLPNTRVWGKILDTVSQGNATLYAPSVEALPTDTSLEVLKEKLGANLLTQIPEIAQWLIQFKQDLDLAAIAYLDGEKHVRVSMAMDAIMKYVSEQKANTSLMYMCTPTDVYAVPEEVIQASQSKYQQLSKLESTLTKGISLISRKHFFQKNKQDLFKVGDKSYGVCDCLVVEQGPNYALAKRIQQWRATLARASGQQVSINIAPSTTTYSVTKNPLLKAAFNGASLFDVEAFAPETTNAIMAALWIHDLRNSESVANPDVQLNHPLELMMSGANHGGLWRVAYLARTALPFAALYGFATDKLPKGLLGKLKK